MANRISEITKLDIFDLFENGIKIDEVLEMKKITYPYFGRLGEIDFLNRLYDLKSMRGLDSRFPDAEGEIWQHTVNNDDYPYGWVFRDERFQLLSGPDEIYLKFICEVFHPAVRDEKRYWKELLTKINQLLQNDGYELYPAEKISNRDIYSWRFFNPENHLFIPYSQRNGKAIDQKRIVLSIKRKGRNHIYQTLESYNKSNWKTIETGWQYEVLISEEFFNDIRKFYIPKRYNDWKQYVETDNLKDFIYSTSPYCVIDVIEFFDKYYGDDFETEINAIFNINDIPLKLSNGKVEYIFDSHLTKSTLNSIGEAGLKELLQKANKYYEEENLPIAVEKIWDAFERLKTYYSPTLNKKESVNRIIDDMSTNKEPFKKMFEKEFHELTTIGNNFRIRHHETTKIDIEDEKHYDYYYKRCLSIITTAIRYLDNGRVF
ncbi:AbiJ-NTD4 domain-containing protein [Oceanobacillus caeni]|uniref:AbiJ-related protein n=1 Tax=Oceanobacillus caeni TaxID=405946 RepID=UPI002E22BBC3